MLRFSNRGPRRVVLFVIALVSCVLACFAFVSNRPVSAAPTTMNFQGRLADSSGNIVANGLYNMQFRFFTVSSGGSSVWSETRETTNRVQVTNGLFTTKLGEVSAIPASLFASGNLFFEITLATPGTATCGTASCATWESAMTPRHQMSTSAYAFNSETLDGIDSAAFAQLGTANTFTNTVNVNVSNANALQVRNGATNLFNVDTSGSAVTIGQTDGTGVVLALDVKNTTGDPTGTNGAIYYNSFSSKFRCYQGVWTDCISAGAGSTTLQDTYNNSSSPATITTTAGKGINIASGAAPTSDIFTITNAGQPVTTAGIEGLAVNYIGGSGAIESAGMRVDYAPGSTSGSTWSGLRIVSGNSSSGVNNNGIKLEGPISGSGVDTAVSVATGWDIGLDIASGGLQLGDQSEPGTVASGQLRIYAKSLSGRMLLRQKGPSGVATPLQPSLFQNQICMVSAGTTTALTSFGCGTTNSATLSHPQPTEAIGYMTNFATTTTSGNESGYMTSVSQFYRGTTTGANGFFFSARISTVDTTLMRTFVGLNSQTSLANMLASDDVAGSRVGFAFSTVRGDTNWQFTVKDGTTQNLVNTGMSFAASKVYDMYFFVPPYPNNGTIYWRLDNLTDDTTTENSTSTNLPAGGTPLRVGLGVETQTTAAKNLRAQRVYVEADR